MRANIELKTLARNQAVLAARQAIDAIKAHSGVTESQRFNLGMIPRPCPR